MNQDTIPNHPIVISSFSCLFKCGMLCLYHCSGVPSTISSLEMITAEPSIVPSCTTNPLEIWPFWGSSSKNPCF